MIGLSCAVHYAPCPLSTTLLFGPAQIVWIKKYAALLWVFPGPVQGKAQRHKIGQQIIKLSDASALRMVRG